MEHAHRAVVKLGNELLQGGIPSATVAVVLLSHAVTVAGRDMSEKMIAEWLRQFAERRAAWEPGARPAG